MRVFDNPVLGDRIEVIDEGGADGSGSIRAHIHLLPWAPGPPLHLHPRLSERYEVVQGTASLRVGEREVTLGVGEEMRVEAGTLHRFWNPTGEPAVIAGEVWPPAPGFLHFLETLYGLAAQGKTDARGRPSPLQAAVLFHAYRREVALASPPPPVQAVVFGLLARLGRLRGYRSRYPEYEAAALARAADREGGGSTAFPEV